MESIKKIPVSFTVPPGLWKRVKWEAVAQDTTLGAIVIAALTEYLGPREGSAPQDESNTT